MRGCRAFELLYPLLNINAEMLIGIGEEVVVTVPTIFGPFPAEIAEERHISHWSTARWPTAQKI